MRPTATILVPMLLLGSAALAPADSIQVCGTVTVRFQDLGPACARSGPSLTGSVTNFEDGPGCDLRFTLDAPPSDVLTPILILGTRDPGLDLTRFGIGCILRANPTFLLPMLEGVTGGVTIPISEAASLIGVTAFAQALSFADLPDLVLSNALRVDFLP